MFNKNKTAHFHSLIAIGIVALASCFVNITFANTQVNINVSLTLYNSYSGSISLVTIGYTTGGITYITDTGVTLDISASDTSTREIMGDIVSGLTGDGVGSYTDTINHFVTAGDGPKSITGMYFKGNEFLIPQPVLLFLDTTPPTMPLGLTPFLAETVNGDDIVFNRSASTDAGAGVKHYRLFVSQSPGFTSPLVYTSTTTTVTVPSSVLPLGTLYRYVESSDNVGNINASFPLYFTNALKKEGAINIDPNFNRPPTTPGEVVNPPVEEPTQPVEPVRRTPIKFSRELLQQIFEAYTAPVHIGEQQPTNIIPGPNRAPQVGKDYTKNPKYPQIFTTKPIKKPVAETVADHLRDIVEGVKGTDKNEIWKNRHLTPEEIEKLKKLLENSPTPIEEYIDNVIPYQVDETTHESATLTPDEVWGQLLETYSQLPKTPFNEEYLQSLLNNPHQIPLLAIILRLFMICYDIETYRQWTYHIAHVHKKRIINRAPKTGQV